MPHEWASVPVVAAWLRRMYDSPMVEILKTNDLVLLSYVQHVLAEAGIEAMVFDGYMSAVEGSIGAFPRRVMVADEDVAAARRALGNIALTIDG